MIVELNDKEFAKSHNGDIFVIEEKNGKKYAKPIKKEDLLKDVYERLEKAETSCLNYENTGKSKEEKQNQFIKKVEDLLKQIALLVGGKTNEENN